MHIYIYIYIYIYSITVYIYSVYIYIYAYIYIYTGVSRGVWEVQPPRLEMYSSHKSKNVPVRGNGICRLKPPEILGL